MILHQNDSTCDCISVVACAHNLELNFDFYPISSEQCWLVPAALSRRLHDLELASPHSWGVKAAAGGNDWSGTGEQARLAWHSWRPYNWVGRSTVKAGMGSWSLTRFGRLEQLLCLFAIQWNSCNLSFKFNHWTQNMHRNSNSSHHSAGSTGFECCKSLGVGLGTESQLNLVDPLSVADVQYSTF